MLIKPFAPLRPRPEIAAQLASLPYDVVSTEEASQLAAHNPLSMLHVVRAEIDFPSGQDPYAEPVYAKAKETFEGLQRDGHLFRDEPGLFVYQQQMGEHTQRGIVALSMVADYDAGTIRQHEKTRRAKEDDRTRLTATLRANPGPVFLTYRGTAEIDALVNEAAEQEPLYAFTAPDGIRHTVWRCPRVLELLAAFEPVPETFIADGHHRAASAARVGRELREANPHHTGDEDYNGFLSVLFPADQLHILPYHRLVSELPGLSPEQFRSRLRTIAQPLNITSAEPRAKGEVAIHLGQGWELWQLPAPDAQAGPADSLDVALLQDRVFSPILGITDPRADHRLDFVGGIRGTDFLAEAVLSGRAAAAFAMHPVTIEDLMDVAAANEIMPPKSTWFEPKLRSGLLIHTF